MREYILLKNGTKAFHTKPYVPEPTNFFVEHTTVMTDLIGCLLNFSSNNEKLFPVLWGPPGVGKTESAIQAYHMHGEGKPFWRFQGHSDVNAEMLVFGQRLVPPNSDNIIVENFLSGISSAVTEGGWCLVDELGKIPVSSLHLLLPIIDSRTFLQAELLGEDFKPNPDFRIIFTCQSNEIINLPKEFKDRIQPIEVPYPERNEIDRALRLKFKHCDLYKLDNLIDSFWTLWETKQGKNSKLPSHRIVQKIFNHAQRLTAADNLKSKSLDKVPFYGITHSNLRLAFESFSKLNYE